MESVYYSAVLDGYHHTESFHDFLEAFEQTQKVIPSLRTLRNLLQVFQSTSTFTICKGDNRTMKRTKSHVKCYPFTQAEYTALSDNFKIGYNL